MLYRCLLYVVLSVAVLGSPRRAAADDIPAYGLQMQTDPKYPGKHRVIEGEAGPQPDRFFLEGLGVLTPISVTIIAKNPGDEITVTFGQDRWDEALQTIKTDKAHAGATAKLRTQGDFKISVTAAEDGKAYWLLVWVGDEVKPELAPVTVSMTKFKKDHPDAGKAPAATPGKDGKDGGGTSPVMIVIAVALVLIVLLLAVVVFRKKGKS